MLQLLWDFNWLLMRTEPIKNPARKGRMVNINRTTMVRTLHDPKLAVRASCLHQS